MRVIFCLVFSTLIWSCSSSDNFSSKDSKLNSNLETAAVIYNEDGRKDYFEVSDGSLIELARSTAVFIENEHLQADHQADCYHLKHEPAKLPMCPGEKYISQPQWGFCSGSLVAPDVILTAGHCVANVNECAMTKIVFDYQVHDKDEQFKKFKSEQVFSCKEIIYRTEQAQGADFALIRLDRPALNRTALKFADSAIVFKDQLLIIGYPLGLPLKFAFDGKVRSALNDKFFVGEVDTFTGNSGSPVFNQQTLELVGVLSRGEKDFVHKNSCLVTKVCKGESCRGEDITRISEVQKISAFKQLW